MTRPFPLRAAPQPAPRQAKRLVILGVTGSIGRSCAQVIGESAGRFAVAAVAAGHNGAALALAARALGARFAAIADPQGYAELKAGLAGSGIEAAAGPEAVVEAALKPADLVVSGIVGAAGLRRPTPPYRPAARSRSPTKKLWFAPATR